MRTSAKRVTTVTGVAFTVLVLFVRALSTTASGPRALRVRHWGYAVAAAVLTALPVLALGASALEVAAPVGFVVLVMALSLTGPGGPTHPHHA